MLADPERTTPPIFQRLRRVAIRGEDRQEGFRDVAEETAVALTYGGSTQAVMMATPADLEDFAAGFSLTERIVRSLSEIESLEVVRTEDGIDIQMWLAKPRLDALAARRRYLAGPTGCGLCGVDSLTEATRPLPKVGDRMRMGSALVTAAMGQLPSQQVLQKHTGAAHAAAFWRSGEGLVALREDVGRHNALDKLVGALARGGEEGASGVVLLTSRVSVEMVQKTAMLGAEILVAVSAPTALAIRTAEAANLTLVAVARADGFEIFTHRHRIAPDTGP
jgi:FdhD protein